MSQDFQGICFSCVFVPHCPCAGPWHLQELLSCPLQLLPAPRACCGSRDRNGGRQPAPAAGDLLLPSLHPFASHTKGSSTGSSHLLSSDHFPLPLFRSSASFPGLYAAPSIPYITCWEQVYLCTLSIMPEVFIAWPASEKIQFPLCMQAARTEGSKCTLLTHVPGTAGHSS